MSITNKKLKQWQKILLVAFLYLLVLPFLWSSIFLAHWLKEILTVKGAFEYVVIGVGVLLGLGQWWGFVLWLRTWLKLEKEFDVVLEMMLYVLWWIFLVLLGLCLGLGGFVMLATLTRLGFFGGLILGAFLYYYKNN